MKLVQINTVCNGGTGKIMQAIQIEAEKAGFETISFVGRRQVYQSPRCERYGGFFSFWTHVFINTVFDKQGYGSYFSTRKIIKRLRQEQPDIIHLHNLHGYYLNLPLLFQYLGNEFQGKIFWTFHDCWPFTGHCAHFVKAGCDKWKKECFDCPNKKQYPISWFFDSSKSNYYVKKRWFSNLKNLSIIVPSNWMKEMVEQSFMRDYPLYIISNGIDLSIFRKREDTLIREKYRIPEEKKILLGVAANWMLDKGLKDFINLSEVIPAEYVIVLVGLSAKQIRKMPKNIIGIKRTEDMNELAEIYSAAHIFINPSEEESFSLVTVEAMACGTPVIVRDTSAVRELVNDKNGIIMGQHESEDYRRAIKMIEERGIEANLVVMEGQKHSVDKMTKKVVELYQK